MFKERSKADRRNNLIAYNRRNLDRRDGVFYYNRRIYLADTQVMGGTVYFGHFWFFIGEAREEFLKYVLGEHLSEIMSSGVNLVTVKCAGTYLAPLFVYDDIRVNVTVKKVGKIKLDLNFEIVKGKGELCFQASMQIAPMYGKKPMAWPEPFYLILKRLEETQAVKKLSA